MIWSGLIDTNCLIRFSSPPYCNQVCSTSSSSNNAVKEAHALDLRELRGLGMVGNPDVCLKYLLKCWRMVTLSHVTALQTSFRCCIWLFIYHLSLHTGLMKEVMLLSLMLTIDRPLQLSVMNGDSIFGRGVADWSCVHSYHSCSITAVVLMSCWTEQIYDIWRRLIN